MARTTRLIPAAAAALALTLLFASPAPAASGKYEDKRFGFSIRLLPGWTQTPTQPGEETEVAKFKDDRKGDFSELSIYRFVKASADATPTEAGEEDEVPVPRPPRNPWAQPENAIDYLTALMSGVHRQCRVEFTALPEAEAMKAGPVEGRYWALEVEHAQMKGYGQGVVAGIFGNDIEEYLIVYSAPVSRFNRKAQGAFLSAMKTFRFAGDTTPDEDEDDTGKRGRATADDEDLIDPEKRARVKKELVGSWRFIDTPHYIVIYNCDDFLARFIADRIEWMRKNAYEVVFPPVEPIAEAMVVRVCKEMDEYHHYGGPRGSAGYWASYKDELVFPDLSSGKKPDEKTLGVLHHEGFHQYINYALLRHDPPVWFNEGFAEYFFCVEPAGSRMKFEKRHPMRYSTIKSAVGTGEIIPSAEFVGLSHQQYMQRAQLCYSQGWAFSTWLKNVTRDERYQQIPETFFRELQNGFLEQKKEEGDGGFGGRFFGRGQENPVIENAYEKAFDGIDLEKLHEDFVGDLKRKM